MAEHHPLGDIEYLRENLLKSYKLGFPILKELIQNAEDAGSTYFDYGWIDGISEANHPLLKDPALFILDNGKFTEENARSIRFILGGSSKPNEESAIGKFGLGLKSVFHLCETFFYISHEIKNPIKPRFDIFNPWAEKDGDHYHKEWDNFSQDDSKKIPALLKTLLNREEYSSEWFILWIPLRQRTHSTQKSEEDGIPLGHIKYSDDDFFGNISPSFLVRIQVKKDLSVKSLSNKQMKKPAATRPKEKTQIEQLSQAKLVEMVLGLQKIIEELQEKLAIATGKNKTTSQTSSKPPSTDLIQKSEKPTVKPEADQKKKPGGQPGHQGKTRKGFGRVDRTEISSPDICLNCGSKELRFYRT